MSKVLVVSDSHGLTSELIKIRERHLNEVDLMLHCGDSELQADDQVLEGYVVVRGNCDFEEQFPEESIQMIDGKRILLTHGHHYNVKSTLVSLSYRAEELKADIACFGHSHILGAEMYNGVLFINPGSIRLPRLRKEKTYCVLEIIDDKVTLNVYDVTLGILPTLKHEFVLHS